MLTEHQLSEFDRHGFVRVPNAFSEAEAARMRECLWDELARQHGVQRDALATWTVEEPRHFQALSRGGVFDAVCSPVLAQAIDDLLGAGTWEQPSNWGVPFVTFPRRGVEWDVPHQRWHMDWPARGSPRPLFGLQVLAYLAPIEARGGSTVVLTGSHRLVERLVAEKQQVVHSSMVRAKLMRAHPWFRALTSKEKSNDRIHRFMVEGAEIDGIPIRVVELPGKAGEAVLLHPWMFHAPAPNCGTAPRMMVGYNIQTPRSLPLYAGRTQT